MFLKKVELRNIRSIEHIAWEIPPDDAYGWHVILGDNGSGKSTMLRAIALSLVGPDEAPALRQAWKEWLRRDAEKGTVELTLDWDENFDGFAKKGKTPKWEYNWVRCGLRFHRDRRAANRDQIKLESIKYRPSAERHVWGRGSGWFSASYGPFRRFSGGDKDMEKLYYSNPKLARHLSIFGESVALSECLAWLIQLHVKRLEGKPEGDLLDRIIEFVNQSDFLPHDTRLESVSSDGVRFVDGNGCEVDVESLSDGFRSILSMTFELIRQLAATYGQNALFAPEDPSKVIVPGVVLVDEIDAHLHPTWQRRVGVWFREHFPRIQFLVTTHSPLVCQSADEGTVFRLPRPGSEDAAGMVTGEMLDRLLYGNVLDAYGTGAFGSVALRSDKSLALLERLAMLNQKAFAQKLSAKERAERGRLRAMLPTAAQALPEEAE